MGITQKAAIFCQSGLGDGILALILSNNFHQNGWIVTTYHNGLENLQGWFPHLPIQPYPFQDQISQLLEQYDRLIIFDNDNSPFIQKLIEEGKKNRAEKVFVIYPYPTQGICLKPYYSDTYLDPKQPIAWGLKTFCKEVMQFPKTTLKNGLIAPLHLTLRKFENRVILHVNSIRQGKNWDIKKYVKLALHLQQKGYEPIFFAGGEEERKPFLWLEQQGWEVPYFKTLHQLTVYLYESGYLIGNDSGVAHLASCMGIPTITISRRKAVARFWKPSWTFSKIVVPSSWIPNLGGFRLRDRKWKKFISVKKVLKAFSHLIKEEKASLASQ